jgi:phenylacetate-coenzyme A ligase PaaK-like adenylate-forming protein
MDVVGREGFRTVADNSLANLIANPPRVEDAWRYGVGVTSGTTGNEPLVVVSKYPLTSYERYADVIAPVNCLGSANARLIYTLASRHGMKSEHSRALTLDAADLNSRLEQLLKEYKPDSIFGFVSFVARVAEYVDTDTASRVRLLNLGGECLSPAVEKMLTVTFPNAHIRMAYIMREVGRVSKPSCEYQPRNHYHPIEGVTIEIHEPDETGAGEILISKKARGADIVRYAPGDMARLIAGPCACGESVTFELLGRKGNDYVKLAGALLHRDEFDRVASRAALFDDYRVEASSELRDGHLVGKIVMRVWSAGEISEPARKEIQSRFTRELFLTPTQTLGQLVVQGIFLPLEVVVSDEPFPRKDKEIKIIQV